MVREERTSGTSLPPDYVMLPLTKVRVGVRLRRPVFDGRPGSNQLLLAAGKQVTPGALEALKNRGVVSLLVHRSDLQQLTQHEERRGPGPRIASSPRASLGPLPSSATTSAKKSATWNGWKIDCDSFLHQLSSPGDNGRDPAREQAFQVSYDKAVETTTLIFQRLVRERKLASDAVVNTTERQLNEIQADLNEFLMRGTSPIVADYPSRHSVQTSMLATAMATVMGYTRDELLDLSMGCLLHDAGMLQIPDRLMTAAAPVTAADRLELQKHPIHSANLIQHCRDISQAARHVVYQMHERMNGSGYPRGRSGSQIHPLARIAAVADTYLALISPRPHRPGLSPYQAVEKLLLSARQGQFDPGVIRALLQTISLFPIGSRVRLSDGRIARVIRSNSEQFARPVVQLIDPVDPAPGEILDLKGQLGIQVTAALDSVAVNTSEPQGTSSAILLAAAAL